MADLDINTEWLRFLGSVRFTIGAIYYILKKRSYSGRLTYVNEEGADIVVTGRFLFFWACNVSHASYQTLSAPDAKLDDGMIYISYLTEPASRYKLLRICLGLEDGSFCKLLTHVRTRRFELEPVSGTVTIDGEDIKCKKIRASQNKNNIQIFG